MDKPSSPKPIAVVFLLLTMVAAASLAPASAWTTPREPCTRAGWLMLLVLAFVMLARRRGLRGARMEYLALCALLAGMPLIYVESGLWHGAGHWFWAELAGLASFAAWAWWSTRQRAWLLALGVAAHGVAWDAWHLESRYMASWYPPACLLVDLGLGLYVFLERRRFHASWSTPADGAPAYQN